MLATTKQTSDVLKKLKIQLWCDFVVGRVDEEKRPWDDDDIEIYIQNNTKNLDDCVIDIIKDHQDEGDLEDIPNDGIREYLYNYCDPYESLEHEEEMDPNDLVFYESLLMENPYQ